MQYRLIIMVEDVNFTEIQNFLCFSDQNFWNGCRYERFNLQYEQVGILGDRLLFFGEWFFHTFVYMTYFTGYTCRIQML